MRNLIDVSKMKICITPKSIQLLATYFKRSIPEVLESFGADVSYDDLIKGLYSKALTEFSDAKFTAYTEGYVLQHLSIVPQMLVSYLAEPGNKITNGETVAQIHQSNSDIYDASQSKNVDDLSMEILKIADVVGVVPIEIIQLTEGQHFDAVSWHFARSILQESIYDPVTGYKENTKDPVKIFETNIQHEILRTGNGKGYRFKLVPYSSVKSNDEAVDTTEYRSDDHFVMVVVDSSGETVKFDEKGNEEANGKFPIFKIKTNRVEFDYQVKALSLSVANNKNISIEEATKAVEERLKAHLENVNTAIDKVKNKDEVFFDMDMGTSSKGFVEINEKFHTPTSKIDNMNKITVLVEPQPTRQNAVMMHLPYSGMTAEIKENSLDQLNVKDRDILIQLFANNNLKDENGNPMTQAMRRAMVQRYVVFNVDSDQRARLTMSFVRTKEQRKNKQKSTSNEVDYVVFNGGPRVYVARAGKEFYPDAFAKKFDAFASGYVAVPTPAGKKVPGRDVAKSLGDVTFNKQYYKDENGNLKLAAKPDISFGLISGVDKGLSPKTDRDVVASIVDGVYKLEPQSLKGHIIANGYTIAMPTKTDKGLILRGHGSYIGFNPMVSNTDINVEDEAVFRSLVQNNLETEDTGAKKTRIKKGAEFAKSTWDAIKRESKETKQAMKILQKMLLGQTVTSNEKQFLKSQSGDLVKGLFAVSLQGVPLPIPLTSILIVAGKKYDFNIFPKDQQHLLEADQDVEAESWYKDPERNPLGQILNLTVIDDINEHGPEFIAKFVKDSITLYKGHSKTDLYHETFHAYFRGILNEKQREDVYDELKSLKGSFTSVVAGVQSTKKFSEGTNIELEEYLAEEFREYAQNNSKYNKKPTSKVAQFFEKLLALLKDIFSNKTVNEVVILNKMAPFINSTFKDLYEGNVDVSKFVAPTSTKETWHSFEASDKLDLSYQDMSITMGSVQALISDYINVALNSTSTNNSNGAVMKRMVQLSTLDINGDKYEELSDSIWEEIHSINNSEKHGGVNGYGIFRLNESPVALTYALNYVKESLTQRLELYKGLTGTIANNNVKMLEKVLNKFGDTTSPREDFKGDDETVLGVFFNNYNIISTEIVDLRDTVDDLEDIDQDLDTRLIYGKTGAEFSPFETADAYTEQLLSSIIKYTGQGEGVQQTNRIGVGRLLPFKTAIGKVVRITKGLTTPSQMYDALRAAAEDEDGNLIDKEVSQIVLKLGKPSNENITRSENRQWTALWSSIIRASQDVRIFTLEKTDVGEDQEAHYIAKSGKFREGSSIVGREWKGNFSDNLQAEEPYIEDGLLNPTKLIESFEDLYAEDLAVESIETLREHAERREVIGYEGMGKEQLIIELAGRKFIPLSGSSALYHNSKSVEGKTYRKNAESFYTANPFPLLKALGINLPATREVRNLLSYGDVSLGIDAGIMSIINKSFSNRENAANEEDKLVSDFDKLFGSYTYIAYSPETGMDEPFTQQDISGYITMLKSIGEQLSDDYVSSTSKNANGDNQSERPYHSALSLQVAELNNAKDDYVNGMTAYDKLIAIPGMEKYNYKTNPEIAANPWIVAMFQLDSADPLVKGTRREDIFITIDTLGGSKVKHGSVEKGITSLASDGRTKYNTDFVHTLLGRQEIMRTEAKATSLTTFAPQFVRGDISMRKGIVLDAVDIESIFSEDYMDIVGNKGLLLYNQFVGHLEAEIIRIARIKEIEARVKNGEDIEFDQAFIDRGKEFFMFDLIFRGESAHLRKDMLNKGVTESFTLKEVLSREEKKDIEKALRDYFLMRARDEMQYATELTIPQNTQEAFKLGEEEPDVTLDRMVKAFIVNNFLQNANFASAFLGDVALYNVAGEDFHKRIAGLIATGTLFRFDSDMYRYLNREDYGIRGFAQKYARENNVTLEDYQYEGYLYTGVMREAKFKSLFRQHYDQFFKGDNPKETVEYHKEMEEADGAAWITFDAYRMLAESNNDWLPQQEAIYQKILKGEKLNQLTVTAAFPVKKYQYYGPVTNDNAMKNVALGMTAFHKYSLLPLIPGTIEGTPLEDLNIKMMENGMDYVTMESGSKLSTITKLTLDGKSEADNIYDKNREVTKETKPFTVNKIHVRHLKNQVSVNAWFKGKITLWTQMRSMISLGLISDGIPIDYKGKKSWEELTPAQKKKESPFWTINQQMHEVMTEIEEELQSELVEELGLKPTIVTVGAGKNKKLVTRYTGDTSKLAKYLQSQMKNEDMLPEEMAYIVDEKGKLIEDLSLSVNAEKIEKMLTMMVDKKLRRLKVNGEGLTNVSGTMLEKKSAKPTLEDLDKYAPPINGTNGLKPYYFEDGSIKSMEVKIALQGDFKKLLRLKHPDKKTISVYDGKEVDFDASLKRLNEAIRDEAWLEKYGDMITITGPRIPSQQENSLESAVVAEFLDPTAGPIIILPSEIVAKTGSDFDHDKLMMMFSNISIYGRGKNASVELQKYDRSLKKVSMSELKDKLDEENKNLSALRTKRENLFTARDVLWKEVEDVREGIKTMTSEEDTKALQELKDTWAKWNGHLNAATETNPDGGIGLRFKAEGVTYNYATISKERRLTLIDQFYDELDKTEEAQDAIRNTYIDRINALQKSSKDISPAVKSKITKNANNLAKVHTDIEAAEKSQEVAHRRFDGKSVKGLENELLQLFSKRITMGDNMAALIQNNATDKVQPISEELEKLVRGNYNKYNRGVDVALGSDEGISGTTLYDYRYNLLKHQENSIAMDSLGIAAVMSTFHAMFTQMGAKLKGVSKADQTKFENALELIKTPKISVEQYQEAMDVIDNFSSYTLKFKHNHVTDTTGRRISLGNRTNVAGETISSIIGQLINGYVDVAKDAWIFNAQGNKENTPVLLFLILAGVTPKTAIYFTSSSMIREYTRMKIEMGGVFSNLTTEHGATPVNDKTKITNEARAKMFLKYSDLTTKNMNALVTSEDAHLISNTINTEYTDKQLRKFVKDDGKATWDEFVLFAHYLEVEDMSNDVTRFTSNTKYSTQKISSLSDATGRIVRTGYAKKTDNSVPNEWYAAMEEKTLNGLMNKDEFYLELFSQYFKLRNHPMVVWASVSIKPPVGVEKTVFQNDVKNDFISFLAQNSLYTKTTYNGVTFVKDENDDAIIDYNPSENTYTYGINTLRNHRDTLTMGLLNENANMDLLNKFPTDNHYIRYDIEYKKLQAQTWDMTDEEIKEEFYYAYSNTAGIVTTQAILTKMALYRSDNNIAMFDYRMGMAGILTEIKKKHPHLEEQFDLVYDIKRDHDIQLAKSNQFLHNIADPDMLRIYKENYSDLKNSDIKEVAEFFDRFSIMALMQTGMNRRSKYDLLRIVNNDIFEVMINEGVKLENVFRALDEGQNAKENGIRNFDTKYLDAFIKKFERLIEDGVYPVRNKGVNLITDDFEGKSVTEDATPIVSLSEANRDAMTTGKVVNIILSNPNIDEILAGNKSTTVRSESQKNKIGLEKGQTGFLNLRGRKYLITYRGNLTVEEAGGKQAMIESEGLSTVKNDYATNPVELGKKTYYTVYGQTANFLDGRSGIHVYDIRKAPAGEVKTPVESISSKVKINIYAGTNENANLSNFAPRIVTNPLGVEFKNVEAAFQYAKTNYAGGESNPANDSIRMELQTATGTEAKALGKKIKGLNVESWDNSSSMIMETILYEMFESNPDALKALLATGNATLTHTQDKSKWGKEFQSLLMKVRDRLAKINTDPISINQKDSDNLENPC